MRTLIENLEFVLTVDAHDTVLHRTSVVVEGSRIAEVGPEAEVARSAGEGLVVGGKSSEIAPNRNSCGAQLTSTPNSVGIRPFPEEKRGEA